MEAHVVDGIDFTGAPADGGQPAWQRLAGYRNDVWLAPSSVPDHRDAFVADVLDPI